MPTGSVNQEVQTFLVPVGSLAVPRAWTVGSVTFHPAAEAASLIPATLDPAASEPWFSKAVTERLDEVEGGSMATVDAPSAEQAIDLVRTALDALRLFQHSRRREHTTTFGLPGDVPCATVRYITMSDGIGLGGKSLGHFTGWTFDETAHDAWLDSAAFSFLSDAIAAEQPTEAQRRAVTGVQMYNVAALERRAGLKFVALAAALEAWLIARRGGVQTLRLARHVAWFGCGRHNESLCGRARPICPYLHLDPGNGADRRRLKILRTLGDTHLGWRCSEWHRVMDWYDTRSHAAHGGPLDEVDAGAASSAEYWIAHYLAEPILEWLAEHPDDPVGELERLVNSMNDPPNWQGMLDALDANRPPSRPPDLAAGASA